MLIAAITAWIGLVNERKRTQPVVISHESRGRHLGQVAAHQHVWLVDAYVTNEGGGPAFNVRFGVVFAGVRYAQRLSSDDPAGGNVQRVLRPSERRPTIGAWPVLIGSSDMFGVAVGGDPDPGRSYWARYENAHGKTWQTSNPGDRSARLDIQRVRFVRLREWWEQKRRENARKRGIEWERAIIEELRAGMTAPDDDEDAPPPRAE